MRAPAAPHGAPFDSLFDAVGHFGRYQLSMFLILAVISFTTTELIFLNFVGYTPDHWCRVPTLWRVNASLQHYVSLPVRGYAGDERTPLYARCTVYALNYSEYSMEELYAWDRCERISANTSVSGCQEGWRYNDSMITQSIVTRWDLVCADAWFSPLVGSFSILGTMVVSLTAGPLSDRFGRRPVLLVLLAVKLVAGFMSAFAPTYPAFLTARTFIGFGATGSYTMGFSILLEMVGPGYRTVTGMAYAGVYSLGFMSVALIGYALRDDVSIQVVMASMPCILIIFIWFVPESPRWLMMNGRVREAEQILRTMARFNGKHLEDFNIQRVSVGNMEQHHSSVMAMMRSAVLRKHAAILCLHWFTDSLIFFAFSMNTAALSGDIYMNTFFMGAVEIPANILAVIFMNWHRVGRRGTAVGSLLVAGLASLISIPIIVTEASLTTVTVLSMVGKAGATMAFNSIYIYSAELFPTEVRNVGLGICLFVSRCAGIMAPYIGGPLGTIWLPLPSLIYGIFGIVTGLVTVMLPETLGTNLPDAIEEVEREDRKQSRDNIQSQLHGHEGPCKSDSIQKETRF